eukprot:5708081-Pyramimonas_sp.AAC.1
MLDWGLGFVRPVEALQQNSWRSCPMSVGLSVVVKTTFIEFNRVYGPNSIAKLSEPSGPLRASPFKFAVWGLY